MEVLEFHGVTRRFGTLTAVDDVSFSVGEGEIVGLLGHNGAGKTTMLRVINGLLPPDAGTVRVRGLDPVTAGDQVRRRTGVLTEYPALDEYLSVAENLEVYAAINTVPSTTARERIGRLLARLDLCEKRDVPTRDLSAGLKQRVALARAFIHDPDVLLLDEPTTNMDPVAARRVRDLVVEVVRDRGRTVLLSTHNLAEAEEVCDRVAIMRHGRLLALGTPAELRARLGARHGVVVATSPGATDALVAAVGGLPTVVLGEATVRVGGDVEVPRLVRDLVAAGVDVQRVEPQQTTLEDLYLDLHHHPADRPAEVAR